MLVRNYCKPVSKQTFKKTITRLLIAKQNPTLHQTGEEIDLYYDHLALPKRMVARMGLYSTTAEARKAVDDLFVVMENVRKEHNL